MLVTATDVIVRIRKHLVETVLADGNAYQTEVKTTANALKNAKIGLILLADAGGNTDTRAGTDGNIFVSGKARTNALTKDSESKR